MNYETRDHIILKILDLVQEKIENTYDIKIDDKIYDDELMDKLDEVFEPYCPEGWTNYN